MTPLTNGATAPARSGIRERILGAESVGEIEKLLRVLDGYEHASDRTISACKRAAHRRRQELEGK